MALDEDMTRELNVARSRKTETCTPGHPTRVGRVSGRGGPRVLLNGIYATPGAVSGMFWARA